MNLMGGRSAKSLDEISWGVESELNGRARRSVHVYFEVDLTFWCSMRKYAFKVLFSFILCFVSPHPQWASGAVLFLPFYRRRIKHFQAGVNILAKIPYFFLHIFLISSTLRGGSLLAKIFKAKKNIALFPAYRPDENFFASIPGRKQENIYYYSL